MLECIYFFLPVGTMSCSTLSHGTETSGHQEALAELFARVLGETREVLLVLRSSALGCTMSPLEISGKKEF
jgi:hypothetical protein